MEKKVLVFESITNGQMVNLSNNFLPTVGWKKIILILLSQQQLGKGKVFFFHTNSNLS